MTMSWSWLATVLVAAAVGASATAGAQGSRSITAAAAVAEGRLTAADREPDQWMSVGRTHDEQRFSPLNQVTTQNVSRLGLAWFADFDTNRGQESTPLAIDGVLYVSTAWSKVKAFEGRTGQLLWAFDPKVPGQFAGRGCCDVVNRGLAAWNGKIYVSTYDGRLIALDAKTGRTVWETLTLDHGKPVTSTGAPRAFKGKVVIGNAGGEFGVRGYLSAYDAETGKLDWRFYTVPGNPADTHDVAALQAAAKTWSGDWWVLGGGAAVWDGIAYDPGLNLVYFGTGNGSPWNREYRGSGGGDNLFVASIVAVNAETGEYAWHYQETPGEQWDFDSTSPIMLADLRIGGKARRVVLHPSKNGFFYVLDAKSGKVVSARNYVPTTWASRIDLKTGKPVINPAARYDLTGKAFIVQPGGQGAHSWHPSSYDPQTGLVYFSAIETSTAFTAAPTFKPAMMAANTGLGAAANADELYAKSDAPRTARSKLVAWDPVKQKEAWRTQTLGTIGGGTLSTAGGLVFQGTTPGRFVAYDAKSGKELWSMEAQTGVVAAPGSYEIDGVQYVAEEVGYGLVQFGQSNHSRLLVFKLDGTASLPPAPPPPPPPVLNPPPSTASKETIEAGRQQFANHCATCHDTSYANRLVFPDLRYSPMLGAQDAFNAIVLDGGLQAAGMASFKGVVSADEAAQIRAYLIERANQLKAAPAGQRR